MRIRRVGKEEREVKAKCFIHGCTSYLLLKPKRDWDRYLEYAARLTQSRRHTTLLPRWRLFCSQAAIAISKPTSFSSVFVFIR
ncbi:MAG: hypothetical protein ACJAZ1_002440 [Yoonia sp.]|jgi:hypothetical protein|tara:strand:+ start:5524 stop:5772 length:249 start_codon:yes stop_codon:yes gene_type:complete